MPLQGILNTARSLSYYTRRQEVTANNLANASSDAFKADRVMAHVYPGVDAPVPVQDIDLKQGPFRETSRPLDLGLDGPGFLVVQTPQGERLTRGGSFQLDATGRLTDSQGNALLGAQGPIILQGGTVAVNADGSLTVDDAPAGQLRVVNVQDPSTLLKEGSGRYAAGGPVSPVNPATTRVRQGAVEEANLDPLQSMVDLVTIQRAYAANIEAMRAMDGVLGSITSEVGKSA